MIPKGLAGFPYQYRQPMEDDFEWDMGSNPNCMICRNYRGYPFLNSTELSVISGVGLCGLQFGCNVSVEFIYLMGEGYDT